MGRLVYGTATLMFLMLSVVAGCAHNKKSASGCGEDCCEDACGTQYSASTYSSAPDQEPWSAPQQNLAAPSDGSYYAPPEGIPAAPPPPAPPVGGGSGTY